MMINEKRGQLKLSFGMIFSIILIIVFLVFAFYAIKMVLDFQGSASIGTFVNNLQNDLDKMWQNGGSHGYTYKLPGEVEEVCFNEEFLVSFKPFGIGGDFEDTKLEHLDLVNPFCVENINDLIKIRIKNDEGNFVTIEAEE